MRFLRHLGQLIRDLFDFARVHKAWWIVPIVLILLSFAALIIIVQAGTPAFIYTLF
ncbi:MAG: DUF5989 family protein [Puniceicoccaceae bacterium]